MQIRAQEEDKDAWKLFLQSAKDGDPRDFEKALRLCKTDAAREEVRRAQGDYYFHEGNYQLAAEYVMSVLSKIIGIMLRLLCLLKRSVCCLWNKVHEVH